MDSPRFNPSPSGLRGSGTNASDVVKEMFRVGYDPIN